MKNSNHRILLPCLQSIHDIWSEDDKRCLFTMILYVYQLSVEDLFLLVEPLCKGMTKNQFLTFLEATSLPDRKMSCAYIRSFRFSFGCINKHICFICPYSGIFKNKRFEQELLLLYYQLRYFDLHAYLQESKSKLENVVRSYIPIYQNEILLDAIPLAFIGQCLLYESYPLLTYLSDPEDFSNCIISHLKKEIQKRVNSQLRKKPYYISDPLTYEQYVNHCCLDLWNRIRHLEQDVLAIHQPLKRLDELTDLDELLVERLFHVLRSDIEKYVPLPLASYKEKIPSMLDETDSGTSVSAVQEKSSLENILSDIPFAEGFENHKSLDEGIIDFTEFQNVVTELNSQENVGTSDAIDDLCMKDIAIDQHAQLHKKVLNQDILDAYELDVASWFTCPASSKEFLTNLDLLMSEKDISIEVGKYKHSLGVLLVGASGLICFYPVMDYGPQKLRKILQESINLYSGHALDVSRYLHSVKIYGTKMFDIRRCSAGVLAADYQDIKSLHDQMRNYPESWKSSSYLTTDSLKERTELDLRFLLCISSISNPPFHEISALTAYDQNHNPVYLYHHQLPEKDGIYFFFSFAVYNQEVDPDMIVYLYKEICVELNQCISLECGNTFVLNLAYVGLLFFTLGSDRLKQDLSDFLKVVTRKVIRKYFGHYCQFQIEIKTHSYKTVRSC